MKWLSRKLKEHDSKSFFTEKKKDWPLHFTMDFKNSMSVEQFKPYFKKAIFRDFCALGPFPYNGKSKKRENHRYSYLLPMLSTFRSKQDFWP